MGLGVGAAVGLSVAYVNGLRRHSLKASYAPVGLTAPPVNYRDMEALLYSHLSQEYKDRGELELGEECITVQEHVFAQIGVIDVNGVRRMWMAAILPTIQKAFSSALFRDSESSTTELEKRIVFCDIGSGVGNVCLQVLAETNCREAVGIEIIPSRIRAAKEASEKAKRLYPDVFKEKEALWFNDDLVDCVKTLTDAKVNVVFTHSWMFDDELMRNLTTVIDSVPSVACVVTSRKLDPTLLQHNKLQLQALMHFSADWNDEAPFYVYGKG